MTLTCFEELLQFGFGKAESLGHRGNQVKLALTKSAIHFGKGDHFFQLLFPLDRTDYTIVLHSARPTLT